MYIKNGKENIFIKNLVLITKDYQKISSLANRQGLSNKINYLQQPHFFGKGTLHPQALSAALSSFIAALTSAGVLAPRLQSLNVGRFPIFPG